MSGVTALPGTTDMSSVLVVALAGCAAALLVGPWPYPARSRLGGLWPSALRSRSNAARPAVLLSQIFSRSRTFQLVAGAGLGAAVGAVTAAPGGVLLGGLGVPAGVLIWDRRRRQRLIRQRTAAVADSCLALAAELRAGLLPDQAMAVVAQEWPSLYGPVLGRASVGGDPATALREVAIQPGAEPLAAVAAAWEVSHTTGASLSSTLLAVTDAVRADETIRLEASSHLASVRTTARLLAVLPVGTLVLFSGGSEPSPAGFLLGHPYGLVCLVAAVAFITAGLGWVEYTARRAVRTAWST
ncbi:type II secretion system F family protein [Phytoactinopolyspora limicola]|uniref:type II secretion system F family protein n=1 Tax=Phytoactinopolyspora limicola TaxID=2715536 RepID=UPI00140A499A|nr:hypothetical protein [Phytoactinopolyspora limicola]